MSAFYQKHFLKLLDFTPAEITALLELAAKLKADKKNGIEVQKLAGKNIALIFEKDSTRTRCSFEVAAYDQGARVTYLGPSGSQIGHKESIKDTARVLGRMYDGIQYRGHGQEVVETLAQYAGVPVWNGLTNEFHPTQLLADLLTMQEHLPGKAFNEMTLVYAGDARNNMGNSMLEAAALTGLDLRLVAPSACWPEAALVETCTALAKQQGGNITLTEDIAAGVKGADFIYTDVWVSMGEPMEVWEERIRDLAPYQVNAAVMAAAVVVARDLVGADAGVGAVARTLAARYRNRGQSLDELEQVACLALTRAVQGFDPERVARWGEADILRALQNPGIVRHRGKIEAAVTGARQEAMKPPDMSEAVRRIGDTLAVAPRTTSSI